MKLFISWSGEFSKKVAERLSIWVPTIIQTVDVFYSPDDIAKGENWSSRLSDELEQSNFGIVCLTPENVLAPWVHFEAGALSKTASSRVSAIMLGVSPSDVKGPLARFQNTALNRDDFHRLFLSINNSHENPLKQSVLDHAFDNAWEKLERDITAAMDEYSSQSLAHILKESRHDERDSSGEALQEILSIVRTLDNNFEASSQTGSTISSHMVNSFLSDPKNHDRLKCVISITCSPDSVQQITSIVRKYCGPKEYLLFKQNLVEEYSQRITVPVRNLPSFLADIQPYNIPRRILQFKYV